MAIISWLSANWVVALHALGAFLTGLIAVFMLIPGDQPEKALQSVVDFLAKFSAKP